MKIENMVNVRFSEQEVKEALLMLMECDVNDTIAGSAEHYRKSSILSHLKHNNTCIENDVDGFVITADGIQSTENF